MNPPSNKTLAKYGLSREEWQERLTMQGGVCAVCHQEPSSGRLCVDHQHVKGWKKLPPEKRKLHVRGLLCWYCNHAYVGRGITIQKSRNVTAYLVNFEDRLIQHGMRIR